MGYVASLFNSYIALPLNNMIYVTANNYNP